MKKKPLRKVGKVKKKHFSLKSWFFTGLIILIASLYVLQQSNFQSKKIKVLVVPGAISDYIRPAVIDINKIIEVEESLAKTDKELTAIRALNKATDRAEKAKSDKAKEETTVDLLISGQAFYEVTFNKNNTQNTSYEDIKKEAKNDLIRQDLITNDNKLTVKGKNEYITTNSKNNSPEYRSNNQSESRLVSSSNTCPTTAFSVYEGETVIGNVSRDENNNTSNEIRGCHNGAWVLVCTDKNSTITAEGRAAGFTSCSVSVAPIYLQKDDKGPNCYIEDGSIVVGYDSVVGIDENSGLQCRGTKVLAPVTNYEGAWLTNSEITEKEDQKKAEQLAAKQSEKESKEERETNCNNQGGVYNSTNDYCDLNVVNPNGTKKAGGETTTKPADCYYGAELYSYDGLYRCKGPTGVVPPPRSNNNVVNPNGNLTKGGEITTNPKDCKYGSEEIAQSSHGIAYKCNDWTGTAPRSLVPVNYGSTPQDQMPNQSGDNPTITPPQKESDKKPSFWDFYLSYSSEDECNRNLPKNKECVPGSLPGKFERVRKTNSVVGTISTNLDPGDCERNKIDGTSCYKIPGTNLKELAASTGRLAGQTCNTDNSCDSGDCSLQKKPSTSQYDWYCMSDSNTYQNSTPVAQGTYYSKPNGGLCGGDNNQCLSGFCRHNIFYDTCVDDPFKNTPPISLPPSSDEEK